MKDFIIEREHLVGYDDVAKIAVQTAQNTEKKDVGKARNFKTAHALVMLSFSETSLRFFATLRMTVVSLATLERGIKEVRSKTTHALVASRHSL